MKIEIDSKKFYDFIDNKQKKFGKSLMSDIGDESVNFFKDSFINQSWDGVKWQKLSDDSIQRKILIERGNLWNSIRVKSVSKNKVEIIADSKYAKIHNEGGKIMVNENMRNFFWSKYKSTGKEKWRALALSDKIDIPKRQFMGNSKNLNEKIENLIIEKFKK
jgi:phage gpG-like protein